MNEIDDIRHDLEGHKFYFEHDGLTALLSYSILENGTLDYKHTFVPEELRGGGLAGDLVLAACQYAQAEGKKIIPSCSFVDKWLKRHKEFADLVDTSTDHSPSCQIGPH
jgi:predicted GNAT family acetyltransferase